MDDYKKLADLIFPDIKKSVADYEKEYPERNLKEGAKVTRYAPSPTGFMHIGNFYSSVINYVLAKQSGGVFFLIWGLLFGIILIIEKIFLNKFMEKLPSFIRRIYVLFIVMILFIIFSSDNMSVALSNIKGLFGMNGVMREKLVYASEHDGLTGLYNKAKYLEMAEKEFQSLDSIAIFNFDVNNLKKMNDQFGHEAGDKLIIKAANSSRNVIPIFHPPFFSAFPTAFTGFLLPVFSLPSCPRTFSHLRASKVLHNHTLFHHMRRQPQQHSQYHRLPYSVLRVLLPSVA